MQTMPVFKFHWIKSGKTEQAAGKTLKEACNKLGYDPNKIMMSECYYFVQR